MSLRRIVLLLVLIAAGGLFAVGQTPAEVERELLRLHSIVEEHPGGEEWEKLDAANNELEAYLLKQTKRADTLAYGFSEFGKQAQIATSGDGRLRIYSWDDRLGGTMRSYRVVFQFRRPDGRVGSVAEEREEGDPGAFVSDIFEVRSGNSTLYLVYSTSIASTSNHLGIVRVFRIGRKGLDFPVRIIKTPNGLTDSIAFQYDFFSVSDRKERPIRLVKFDSRSRTLRIPVVIETERFENGEVTNRFINYRFNGRYFVRVR